MGITVQHNYGGAVIGAAYGAGRNRSRQRQQKYMLDFQREQELLAQRRAALFMRGGGGGAARGVRGGVGSVIGPGGVAGHWEDRTPKYGTPEYGDYKARMKGAMRKRRMGKDPGPSPYDPEFIPGPTEEEKEAKDREYEEGRLKEKREYEEGEERKRREYEEAQRSAREADARERSDRESGAYTKETERALDEVAAEIDRVTRSERIDDARKKGLLQDLRDKQRALRAERVEPPTPAEKARKGVVLWDPDAGTTANLGEGGPNSYPVPIDSEGNIDWKNAKIPEDMGAARAKEKEKAAAKHAADVVAEFLRLKKESEDKESDLPTDDAELEKLAAENVNRNEEILSRQRGAAAAERVDEDSMPSRGSFGIGGPVSGTPISAPPIETGPSDAGTSAAGGVNPLAELQRMRARAILELQQAGIPATLEAIEKQVRQMQLPPGAVEQEDGTILYNGMIHRRKS